MQCKRYEDFMREYQYYRTFLWKYRKTGKVFTDHYFHPRLNIHETKVNLSHQKTEWRRIDEIYKAPLFDQKLINMDYVKQGELGDCYFMSGISRIAKQPELVVKLFDRTADTILGTVKNSINIKCGAVVIFFHAFGRKTPVLIDTLIPFHKGTNNLRFSYPANRHVSPWFCLVEKAYAKLYGSYSSISGGQFYNAIYSLFGYQPLTKSISSLIKEKKQSKKSPFERITEYHRQYGVTDCYIDSQYSKISHQDIKSVGLVADHSYLLEKAVDYKGMHFFRIRNPWGRFEWLGDWSDKSKLWTKELREVLHVKNSNDGTFWMIEKDFLKYFTTIDVSRPIPNNWYSKTFSIDMWPGKCDGYFPEDPKAKIHKRPNFAIRINQKVPDNEKVSLFLLIERRSYFPDKVTTVKQKPSQYIVIFANSNGRKLSYNVLKQSKRFYLTVSTQILGYKYNLAKKGEILTVAIQRIQKMDFYEECSIRVACKFDFDVYDIDYPKELVPENDKTGALFTNSSSVHKCISRERVTNDRNRRERNFKRKRSPRPNRVTGIQNRDVKDDNDDDDGYDDGYEESVSESDSGCDVSESCDVTLNSLKKEKNDIQCEVNRLVDDVMKIQDEVNRLVLMVENEEDDEKVAQMADEIEMKRNMLESLEEQISSILAKEDAKDDDIENARFELKSSRRRARELKKADDGDGEGGGEDKKSDDDAKGDDKKMQKNQEKDAQKSGGKKKKASKAAFIPKVSPT